MGSIRTSGTRAGVNPSPTTAATADRLTRLSPSSSRRNASSTSASPCRAARCKIPRYSRSARADAVAANRS